MIQVYTGSGKGKTTAALGLALRAAGAGKRVFLLQFLKCGSSSELSLLRRLPGVTVRCFGSGKWVKEGPAPRERELAGRGFAYAKKVIAGRKCDMLILDEINPAMAYRLLEAKDVCAALFAAPAEMEIVLTGRCAIAPVKRIAHLVSEVREVRHYFKQGVKARKGIEF